MIDLSQRQRDDILQRLIDDPRQQRFADSWSAERVVVAAPDLDNEARGPFLAALAPRDEHLLCLTTTDAGHIWPHQSVVAAPAEVNDWRWEMLAMDVVIARCDLSAALLETIDEFILIGGDRNTIEMALGQTVEDARAEFVDYAKQLARAARHLPGVAEQYRYG